MGRHGQTEIIGILEGVPPFANLTKRQLRAAANLCTASSTRPVT